MVEPEYYFASFNLRDEKKILIYPRSSSLRVNSSFINLIYGKFIQIKLEYINNGFCSTSCVKRNVRRNRFFLHVVKDAAGVSDQSRLSLQVVRISNGRANWIVILG